MFLISFQLNSIYFDLIKDNVTYKVASNFIKSLEGKM